jgi:glycosyltransferase involved in cell wall biosynthesis
VNTSKKIIIGIDAANIRRGGGVTHLVELLRAARPYEQDVEKVIVWGGSSTLNLLESKSWLEKINPIELDKNLFRRILWQKFKLSREAKKLGCDVLFVPGGSYAGNFHPVVNMSRNLLPFEWKELLRYGWSIFTIKLLLLRIAQKKSYKKTDGLIFLTDYARKAVTKVTGRLTCKIATISHGVNFRFNQPPKFQYPIDEYSDIKPYRINYVSIIDEYKHQCEVVEAIAILRNLGYPLVLDLVGPAYPSSLQKLNKKLDYLDPNRGWAFYHGSIPFDNLHEKYSNADLGIFASSCENMPNILLETMSSGLPVSCSSRGPMPEVLGDAGVYFDPEKPSDIARALHELIVAPRLRTKLAHASYVRAQQFSWQSCADQTFKFLASFA